MTDCIFCNIVNGIFESRKVYEDDLFIAIMDIQPVNIGHVLVLPKKHVELIVELNEVTNQKLFELAQKINRALRKSILKPEGVNYYLSDGEAAGQEIHHVHLHIFPRYLKDGFGLNFPANYPKVLERNELNDIADKIKMFL